MDKQKHYLTKLFEIKSRLGELCANKQINPKIADDLILIAQQKVKRYLNEIFETKYSDLIALNKYSEFILYSYKSYYGEIPAQTTSNNQVYKRRLNLYRKGKRWDDNTGKIFYSFLDRINEKFKDTPINLYGELCSKYNKRYLIIKYGKEALSESNSITLPHYSLLKDIKDKTISVSGQLRTYIEELVEDKLSKVSAKLSGIETAILKVDIDNLLQQSKNNDAVTKFLKQIKTFFCMSENDFSLYHVRIIKSFFTYQFNDLEFTLHLLFPDCSEFLSTLMIAVEPNKELSEETISSILNVTNELKFLEVFEKDIVDRTRQTNDSFIIWKNIYEREYNKLYTFMRSVENISYSVCKQNNISFSHISGRVKTFESLYNKIFKRANDPLENEKLKDKHGITYTEAIQEPHLHYNKVFDIIRDLAGVRIVLLFEDDLEEIKSLFEKLDKSEDLVVKDIRFYKKSIEDEDDNIPLSDKDKIFNYRSLHLTVMPGKNRLNLIEYRNLFDIQCEIQFRSVLAHAWADVNHDLEYKHRDVIKEVMPDVQDTLKSDFTQLSENLLNNDKFLNIIRKKGTQIKLD